MYRIRYLTWLRTFCKQINLTIYGSHFYLQDWRSTSRCSIFFLSARLFIGSAILSPLVLNPTLAKLLEWIFPAILFATRPVGLTQGWGGSFPDSAKNKGISDFGRSVIEMGPDFGLRFFPGSPRTGLGDESREDARLWSGESPRVASYENIINNFFHKKKSNWKYVLPY